MIDYVVEHLRLREPHRFIFVCLAEHALEHRLSELFAGLAPGHALVLTETITRGPAATTLLAAPLLDPHDELLVAYCDCFFTVDINAFLDRLRRGAADGGVLVYPSAGSMEAYGVVDSAGRVQRIVEKQVISGDAIAGLYYFRRAADFVSHSEAAIAATPDAGEIFVSTICNNLIGAGGLVLGQLIERRQRIEMGTPADLALSRFWLEAQRTATTSNGAT
jgi:NDP-sugar pyrophosphorylase family protein